jgi:hypothetical protein
MNISPEEAARALGEIEASRAAMRTAVRGFRGHYYLWLWGGIWMAMALRAEFRALPGLRMNHWLIYPGIAATFLIMLSQGTKIRSPINKRFLGVLAAIVVFSFVWPMVLGHSANGKSGFAYGVLVPMFCYIVAGIWFDCYYLLWVGLLISALILASLFFFPAFFWWSVVLCGGALVGTGFYVRYFWR